MNIKESIFNLEVSLYENIYDTNSQKRINLWTWLADTKYRKKVEELRRETDPDKKKNMKKMLPCITVCGVFDTRYGEGLICYSGLMCIDIDRKDNLHIKNFNTLKDQISKIKNVAYCAHSVSGEGYFLIIPVSDDEEYETYFRALEKMFSGYGIIIDKSGKNINRLRTVSYDPEPYWNEDAIEFKKTEEYVRPIAGSSKKIIPDALLKFRVEDLIKKIIKHKIDITGSYYEWFRIGCAFANEFGESGRTYFHDVSQFYKFKKQKYSARETDEQFNSCLKSKINEITIGTFFYYCDQHELNKLV